MSARGPQLNVCKWRIVLKKSGREKTQAVPALGGEGRSPHLTQMPSMARIAGAQKERNSTLRSTDFATSIAADFFNTIGAGLP